MFREISVKNLLLSYIYIYTFFFSVFFFFFFVKPIIKYSFVVMQGKRKLCKCSTIHIFFKYLFLLTTIFYIIITRILLQTAALIHQLLDFILNFKIRQRLFLIPCIFSPGNPNLDLSKHPIS